MQKNQKIIFFGGIGVLVCLIGLIVALIVSNSSRNHEINEAEARADSLRLVNDRLQLSSSTPSSRSMKTSRSILRTIRS